MTKFLAENPLAVVFFTEATSGDSWENFKTVAMNNDKIVFAHSTVAEVAAS